MKIAFIGDHFGKVHYRRFQCMQKHMGIFDFYIIRQSKLNKVCSKYDGVYFAMFTMNGDNIVSHPNIFGSATSWKCITGKSHVKDMKTLKAMYKVSANNQMLFSKLKKYRSDISCIPNGVDTDFFSPVDYIPKSKIVIGWCGNSDRKEKRYDIFRKVSKKFPQIEWKSIATSKSTPVKKMKNRDKMRKFYRSLDYFLVTSSHEGTPNPALEAAACGVPLISTPVGNMPEVIENNVNGFLVDPNTIENSLESIRSTCMQDYIIMRNNIRQTISSKWTWNIACSKFSSFFGIRHEY